MTETKQRTLAQNRAMHKLFTKLSEDLNTLGLEMKVVLKPSYQVWWTPELVKENLWKPMQKAIFQKESTTELETSEVTKVYEAIAKGLGEKFGVEIEFPSADEINKWEHYKNIK